MLKRVFILFWFLFLCFDSNAQIIINTLSLGFGSGTPVCASSSFNTFNLGFKFFPLANLLPGEQFVIELSDANGDFTNPITLKTFSSAVTTVNTSVSFPNTVYGKNYQIRIRSTNPLVLSVKSVPFSVYYAIYNQSFTINNNVAVATMCNGQPVVLSVDSGANSPLQYPSLIYRWKKNGVVIPGETGSTLTVNQAGDYYVEVDYGTCSYNAYSNVVTVGSTVINPNIQISDFSNQLCEGVPKQLICSVNDINYGYTWYKDGQVISGATTYTYDVQLPGTYKVVLSNSGCTFTSNEVLLESKPISASINPLPTSLIIPGQQFTLTTTTDALLPSYIWYQNDVVIPNQTGSSLPVFQNGTYELNVTQNQGCLAQSSSVITIQYPTGFDLGIQNTSAYTSCQSTTASLAINKFQALTGDSPVDIIGNTFNYGYQWYKDGVAVPGATTTSLNLSGSLSNGSYKLGATIPGFGEILSNSFDVQLNIADDITISNNLPLCKVGDTVVLQSKLSDPNYAYDWYFNGVKTATNNAGALTITQAGDYYLIVRSGTCSSQSNTVSLQLANFNLSVSSPTSVLIPSQQMILTATTAALQPTYSWYKDGVPISNQTGNTLNIAANGTYSVTVTQKQGCLIDKSSQIAIQYPTGFDLGIQNTSAYTSCQSTTASLAINKFQALTATSPIDIIGNTFNYGYQWYKDGVAVPGATTTSLNLSGSLSNGSYKLGATIAGFGEILSNAVDVQLNIAEDITITNNSPLCKVGDTVVLQSKLSDPNYAYDWYFNGVKTATNNAGALTITQAGDYYLIVRSGTCSSQSNTVSLQLANFNLSVSSPTSVLIPSQQMILTATTAALQPTYSWSKDGVPISNQTGNTLNIAANGTYSVTVTQKQGCLIDKSSQITIQYPTGFSLSIKNASSYISCQNTTASLVIDKFQVLTESDPINIIANTFNYGYQWYKDGVAVPGATTTSLNLSGSLSNGSYKLGVTIPDFGEILSNSFDVQLIITEDITISNNSPLCKVGDTVVLQSKFINPNYFYDWYFNGAITTTNNTGTITVTQPGNYYLIVRSGTCSLQSNSIILKEGLFGVFITPETSFIVPGQVMKLTVSTGASQPAFSWYKNGAILNGENSTTLKVSDPGVYKVIVDQTLGCIIENSAQITIAYPSGFTVTISPDAGYQDCNSASTTLHLSKMVANSPSGDIDLTTNPYNYTFQWYKNNAAISGGVNSTLLVSDYSQNDNYKLQVIIPDFTEVYSNSVGVLLGFATPLTITQTGVFCDEGSEVTLTANYTDPAFTYQWFEASTSDVIGTENTIVVNKSGNYYLKISQNGCSLISNTIAIHPYDFSKVSVDTPDKIVITEGESKVITASGGDSYQWYFNNQLISTDNSYKVTLAGVYTLIVKVATCQKTFTFEVTYHEKKYVIANTVTPNGDGFNDYWSIPLEYAYVDNIQVTIYDTFGNIILRTTNYQNNWPDGSSQLPKDSPVCYFTIEKVGGSVLKEGSITVVK